MYKLNTKIRLLFHTLNRWMSPRNCRLFALSICTGQHSSIQHIVQTWPQVIFTYSEYWRNFWVADAPKAMKKRKMPSRSGSVYWWQRSTTKAYSNLSDAVTSAWMLVATV